MSQCDGLTGKQTDRRPGRMAEQTDAACAVNLFYFIWNGRRREEEYSILHELIECRLLSIVVHRTQTNFTNSESATHDWVCVQMFYISPVDSTVCRPLGRNSFLLPFLSFSTINRYTCLCASISTGAYISFIVFMTNHRFCSTHLFIACSHFTFIIVSI